MIRIPLHIDFLLDDYDNIVSDGDSLDISGSNVIGIEGGGELSLCLADSDIFNLIESSKTYEVGTNVIIKDSIKEGEIIAKRGMVYTIKLINGEILIVVDSEVTTKMELALYDQ